MYPKGFVCIGARHVPRPASAPPSLPARVGSLPADLEAYHELFAPLYQRREQAASARRYLLGLLSDKPRKSVERMVLKLQGPKVWRLMRRHPHHHEFKTYLCHAPADRPLAALAHLAGRRWPIESCFQEGKQNVGLGDYEGRRGQGWHRHMTLCLLAYFFLVRQATRLKKTPRPDCAPSGGRTPHPVSASRNRLAAGTGPAGLPPRAQRGRHPFPQPSPYPAALTSRCSTRSASGPGPLLPQPLCQGQGAALGQPEAVDRGVLGPPVWALPFLTVLVPPRHYHEARGRHHKTITDGAARGCASCAAGYPTGNWWSAGTGPTRPCGYWPPARA